MGWSLYSSFKTLLSILFWATVVKVVHILTVYYKTQRHHLFSTDGQVGAKEENYKPWKGYLPPYGVVLPKPWHYLPQQLGWFCSTGTLRLITHVRVKYLSLSCYLCLAYPLLTTCLAKPQYTFKLQESPSPKTQLLGTSMSDTAKPMLLSTTDHIMWMWSCVSLSL